MAIDDNKIEFEHIMKIIKKFKEINRDMSVFEIGVGSGWFQILAAMNGIACRGLEINPQVAEYAQQHARKYGAEIDIDVGDIEQFEIGISKYDIIIASSVFEHVKDWQKGVEKAFTALRPDGLFYFSSTNKFSFKSGEYDFPLYGWLPNSWRYRLRKARQGEDILEYGIDFHQFTFFQLRRFFYKLGFTKVFDLIDILDPNFLNHPTLKKKFFLRTVKASRPLKHLALFFAWGTHFLCIK
jgi:2-polyprenyl-3-methyl-5-hydroxy-6-metoxy-1,4-benzoquinol methylase